MGLETICIEFMSCGDALRLYEQIHILNEIEVSDHQVTVSDVTTPSVTHIQKTTPQFTVDRFSLPVIRNSTGLMEDPSLEQCNTDDEAVKAGIYKPISVVLTVTKTITPPEPTLPSRS